MTPTLLCGEGRLEDLKSKILGVRIHVLPLVPGRSRLYYRLFTGSGRRPSRKPFFSSFLPPTLYLVYVRTPKNCSCVTIWCGIPAGVTASTFPNPKTEKGDDMVILLLSCKIRSIDFMCQSAEGCEEWLYLCWYFGRERSKNTKHTLHGRRKYQNA
jgi:hypothetical protein